VATSPGGDGGSSGGDSGTDTDGDLMAAIVALRAQVTALQAAVAQLQPSIEKAAAESHNAAVRALEIQSALQARAWPVYEGSIRVPYLGSAPVTLSPKVQQ
jgi:uncharacterized protein YlxW (UPF0749 family)